MVDHQTVNLSVSQLVDVDDDGYYVSTYDSIVKIPRDGGAPVTVVEVDGTVIDAVADDRVIVWTEESPDGERQIKLIAK
ncbi:MAG: hypothetical protein HY904_13180 [Deltaproteobacteria bacterium]|nr:hypothetical protein [Deltaproteobacteria bacterium]